MNTVTGLRKRVQSYFDRRAHLLALALIVPGVLSLYVKMFELSESDGLLVFTRSAGLNGPESVSVWARLGFLQSDIVLGLLILPIGWSIAWSRSATSRLARAATILVACALLVLDFVSLLSLANVGRLIGFDMLVDAVHFALNNRDAIAGYVSARSIIKLVVVVTLVPLAVYQDQILQWIKLNAPLRRNISVGTFIAVTGCATILSCAAFAGGARDTYWHRALVVQAIRNLVMGPPDRHAIDVSSSGELVQFYRRFVRSPTHEQSAQFNAQHGSDVVIIVLETGPNASIELDGGIDTLPAIGGLAARAVVARQHFSTYPYTSDAMFSIFSGMYPVGMRKTVADARGLDVVRSALPAVLADSGYNTYRFSYQDTFDADAKMYRAFGMGQYFEGDAGEARNSPAIRARVAEIVASYGPFSDDGEKRTFEIHLRTDLACLAALREQITRSKRAGERFMSVFLPIVGHGPWPNIAKGRSVATRGRRLIELQDGWIGAIVDDLRAGGWLDDTIIVLTADHGVRTKQEDPGLQVGTLNEYSYHVPLVVSAPKAFATRFVIDSPTSHIDIEPTILELLGIDLGNAPFGQGNSMFDRNLGDRTTFMFSTTYHGIDGFTSRKHFYMKRVADGQKFASDHFHFGAGDFVDPRSEVGMMIDETLATMNGIQDKWAKFALQPPAPVD